MAIQNKRKLATLNKENCDEHPRSNLAQNSNVPRSQEDYLSQVSEEIEGRVTKRLSKEFSRTENRILGALARLDDFFMNPLLQGHSGALPERIKYKPGNEWGRLPEWSSSWSGLLPRSDGTKLWPRKGLRLRLSFSSSSNLFLWKLKIWRTEFACFFHILRSDLITIYPKKVIRTIFFTIFSLKKSIDML